MKKLYTAHATSVDGRKGHVQTDDGNLSLELGSIDELAKKGNKKTNPEQLFACGYAACFGSAIDAVAKKENVDIRNLEVHAQIDLNQDDKGGFFISGELNVVLPGLENEVAQKLVRKAHEICPYSKATRGNVEISLKVNSQDLKQAA